MVKYNKNGGNYIMVEKYFIGVITYIDEFGEQKKYLFEDMEFEETPESYLQRKTVKFDSIIDCWKSDDGLNRIGYKDDNGDIKYLTNEELEYFYNLINKFRMVFEIDRIIIPFNFDYYNKSVKEAVHGNKRIAGACGEETGEIRISSKLIHDNFEKIKNNSDLQCMNIIHVICHELAHLKIFNHNKEHQRLTSNYYNIICKKFKGFNGKYYDLIQKGFIYLF
jgi:hypothetical protein